MSDPSSRALPDLEGAERYRLLFERNPLPMWIYHVDSLRILDVNRAAVDHYGYSRERFLEMTLADLRPGSGLESLERDVAEARAKGGPRLSVGHVHLKADGAPIEVEVAADDVEVNGARLRVVVVHDVTDARRAERELRASEERYRQSFEESLTANYLTTRDGRLVDCNRAYVELFGFASKEEALATPTREIFPEDSARDEFLAMLAEHGVLRRMQTQLRRRDGGRLEVIENAAATFDESGEIAEIRGYLFDITDHLRLEEQLRESQKMEAVGRLAGGIAHEFNNILAVIVSSASFAREGLPEDHPVAADLRGVVAAADRAARLTEQLLAFGRRGTTRREMLDLNGLVAGSAEALQGMLGEDIQLELRPADRPLRVVVDAGQLQLVLLKLAVNAREAMPAGGVLRISTERRRLAEGASALGLAPGRFAVVSVADSGGGMPPEVLERCFDPFFTTRGESGATGLGLPVAFGIARQHGGALTADSAPGDGATFRLFLPLVDDREPSGEVPRYREPPERARTILVCEDESAVREAVRRILEGAGYQVIAAGGPGDALLSLERYRGPVDLLLSDVVMPQMSGVELVRRGLAARPDMRVLLMSGRVDDDLEATSVHPVLRKPFDRASLLAAVARALGDPA